MGLLQRAVETYDAHQDLVGMYEVDKVPLAPIGHITASAAIEIVINGQGDFRRAHKVDKNEQKIIIPATEESAGRSSTSAKEHPHPLCDKLSYYTAKEKFFLSNLEAWVDSPHTHPLLLPILTYLRKGTIEHDLNQSIGKVKEDSIVRWRVEKDGDSHPCWQERELFEKYIQYYLEQINKGKDKQREKRLCMISGEMQVAAKQHPKGIVAISGNAKLISANDKNGFTYRGRFSDDWQAATVSYIASQKAHNALRWLIANQGEIFGGRTFLCWNPRGILPCKPTGPFLHKTPATVIPSDYRRALHKTLLGYRSELPDNEWAVIAVFDAASKGRLAVTYFNELRGSDYLQRLCVWDEHCCWWYGLRNGKYVITSPSLIQIVNGAFGVQRAKGPQTKKPVDEEQKQKLQSTDGQEKDGFSLVTNEKIFRQQLQRLMSCRLDKAQIGADVIKALVDHASLPQHYEKSIVENYDRNIWREIVYTACAALNYYHYHLTEGDDAMSWEMGKKDRSFQFGRLLAAMERLEMDFYQRAKEKTRQTNAIKYLDMFRKRPLDVFDQVNGHLETAYAPRVWNWQKERYERYRDEIMEIILDLPEEDINKPLDSVYLMGYERQRIAFFKEDLQKNTDENSTTKEE